MQKNIRDSINFVRADRVLVESFRDLPAANVDDCMDRTAAIDSEICPVNHAKLLGTAFTVRVPAGDNLMFHKAMDLAQPGDVIMIDAGGGMERAIFGELMTTYCQTRGIAGLVVDGCIRDREELSHMSIPVYARGASPNGPYKNGPGEIGTVISLGGQTIRPGDIILGDQDGVIVIKPEDAEKILASAKGVEEKEKNIKKDILEKGEYIRPWVDEKLKSLGYII